MKKEDGRNKWRYLIILVLAALILLAFINSAKKDEIIYKFKNFFGIVISDWSMLLTVSLLAILVLCVILFAYDGRKIRQMKEAEEAIKIRCERDPLTGVYNRSIAQNIIEDILKEKLHFPALIMFDLDSLKNVNETFGHETGDHVLTDFSGLCISFFGEDAVVSRVGGDEFIVFLPDAGDEQALREQMTSFFIKLSEMRTDGVSIRSYAGVAAFPGKTSWGELYRQADTALYVAKRGGKSPYVLYKKAYEREVLMSKQKLLGTYTEEEHDEMLEKSELNANDMFVWLIEKYKLETSEYLLLSHPKDFIMVVNPEDMTITKVLTSSACEGSPYEGWVGRKCYEAFEGHNEKCANCIYDICNHNSFVLTETHSNLLDTDFVQRAGFLRIEDEDCFIHLFKAVNNVEEANEEYKKGAWCQNIITSCACSDVNYLEEPERYFGETINTLCSYYGAEQGYIVWNSGETGVASLNIPENEIPSSRRDISEYARNHWSDILGKHIVAYIDDIAKFEDIDAKAYRYFAKTGVKNLFVVPIWDKTNVYGYMYIKNLTKNTAELSTAGTVSVVLLECMKMLSERDAMKSIRYYDETTGYLNFDGFKRCMRRVSNGKKYALCAFDIIKFKFFNEVFGYDIGNIVLKNVADMFARMLREEEFMCRISADNFCALFEYNDEKALQTKIEEIVEAVVDYFRLNYEGRYLVELAAGVYLIPENNKDSVDTMLNMATIAKKRAKQEIGNKVRFYDDDLKTAAMREIELESNMDEAIKKEEFKVYLQPQVYIGKAGPETVYFRAEALCRWVRNNDFYALPSEFIPLFEHDGRITKLDMYMLNKVCGIVKKLREEENMSSCIAVNLSRATILQPDFLDRVEKTLSEYDIQPGEIELEFTEGVAVTNYDRFAEIIRKLKKLGCYCAMDDFGSELSSLNVLQNLPVDVLKLDKKFFESQEDDERQSSIVRDTINMARDLDMRTIAEGIENKRQVSMLRQAECDFIQGFVYARPMPVLEYVKWVKNN